MHLAVGTSFGIIIPTSIVSVITHHQHKAVDFKSSEVMDFLLLGVILGTILAASLKTKPLILFFIVVFILFLSAFFKRKRTEI